ncbi:SIR2 family protein [Rhodococcus fascians]|nr:SIR2 family protein [Rhodococcus fascians]MBY3998433.1 SIR2 family protein [Rhodococcus fascians]MBY4004572.1 SIR2 family protein [Rhodococcus fascians]MBY4009246.1 SIR2 family protein [Rhodococcus fascians]MBY4019779.1 SIR2 family protein [Rhodococcus fascians]
MTESFAGKLGKELSDHSALPYLFVGSGLSRRYLGLPDWQGLLQIFSEASKVDYDYLFSSADGNLAKVASALAESFHDVWWQSPEYEDSRAKNGKLAINRQMALKIEVASYIQNNSIFRSGTPGFDDKLLKSELEQLKKVVVGGIITTNYDQLTDTLFPKFPAYVGQQGLLLSDAQFVAESYKIHGSSNDPASLVLTQEDYEYFDERNKYLAAKLLTIFVEHPVIFMGYRMGDRNIQNILENIAQAAGPEKIQEIGARLYFVDWKPGASQPSIEPYTIQLSQNLVLPLQKITLDSFQPLFAAMENLERPYPAQVVRELTKYVYDLVRDSSKTRQSVTAVPLNSPGAEHLKVVFGVGEYEVGDIEELSSMGLRGVDRARLAQDLLDTRPISVRPDRMLAMALPEVLKRASYGWVPVFKYLNGAGRISKDGKVDYSKLPDSVRQCATRIIEMEVPAQSAGRFEKLVDGVLKTPNQVMESDHSTTFKLDCLLLLDPSHYSLDDLKVQLIKILETSDFHKIRSQFFRALCHYDHLKFGTIS